MRSRQVVIAAAGVLIMAGLVLAAQDDAGSKADLKKLSGSWKLILFEEDGREEAVSNTMTIKSDKFTMEGSGNSSRGQIKLDATQNPKLMDLVGDDGKTRRGIYEVKGDVYIVCFAKDEKASRPTDFTSKKGARLIVRKRVR